MKLMYVHCPSRTLRGEVKLCQFLLGCQPSREWKWSGVPASGIDPAESELASWTEYPSMNNDLSLRGMKTATSTYACFWSISGCIRGYLPTCRRGGWRDNGGGYAISSACFSVVAPALEG
jgi:hypothetical protein